MIFNISIVVLLSIVISSCGTYKQPNNKVQELLNDIGEQTTNSKEIKLNESAIKIINSGSGMIPKLIGYFINRESTKTYSDCQGRNLIIGEIAIILVDRIEPMPYFTITGIQNCTLQFCEGNDNLIEYYLLWDEERTIEGFTNKYSNWFLGEERDE